jgi:hypothetical protein
MNDEQNDDERFWGVWVDTKPFKTKSTSVTLDPSIVGRSQLSISLRQGY